ncbi:MAG: MBL fold metallo-hydrolase [Pseudomonadales bacterium]|nr:MBL fold metallo-hydrolase [Pseudomonadales bacterium]
MKVAVIPVTTFQQNCSLVWCPETKKGALIDPGGDLDKLQKAVEDKGVTIEKVLLTHAHIDHAGAAADASSLFNVPIIGPHKGEVMLIDMMDMQSQMSGIPGKKFTPDQWLKEGDTVSVGNLLFEVLFCPGHTPGHLVFYARKNNIAFVGDVLFKGSIGRTDLPGGDTKTLLNSIKTKLFPLSDNTVIVSGHGPNTTIGQEKQHNPFIKA